MSPSVFKMMMQCEAAELALLKGDYEPSNKDAILVGNFVHSFFESQEAHQAFIDAHPEIISTRGASKGHLKSQYKTGEHMINRLCHEELFTNMDSTCEHEVIVTGKLFGYDWKGKVDALNVEQGFFMDYKTVDDIAKRNWSDKYYGMVDFIRARDYLPQMWVYRQLLEQKYGKPFTCFIWAVSKQTPSDVQLISPSSIWLDPEESWIQENIDRVEQVLAGEVAPKACGHCEYCRGHKSIHAAIDVGQILAAD
ncbi:PD-(D/E)XK nuclease-like domain-containing protein [Furfurilactobacillus siliginis]|uniref:Prophage lp1 protein 19 n=2 Tax=Furfurilactobacillus siliginis TaxID=348151 RepID=A0A0R2L4U7_9LACO|nr:PD-(D/E)XK nuclease-like domain-containing protein [Furfurilactobacillus siliginis]KRN96731.1 prophage lp1 protein 19 [Furfurilactobacillus siliginis]